MAEEAYKAKESPEFIADMKESKDRLVEKDRDVLQHLNEVLAQQAGPAGEVLTAAP